MSEKCSIYSTQYWDIVLVNEQTYLGRSVVILKRPCTLASEDVRHQIVLAIQAAL